jgi:hypothetical protein
VIRYSAISSSSLLDAVVNHVENERLLAGNSTLNPSGRLYHTGSRGPNALAASAAILIIAIAVNSVLYTAIVLDFILYTLNFAVNTLSGSSSDD